MCVLPIWVQRPGGPVGRGTTRSSVTAGVCLPHIPGSSITAVWSCLTAQSRALPEGAHSTEAQEGCAVFQLWRTLFLLVKLWGHLFPGKQTEATGSFCSGQWIIIAGQGCRSMLMQTRLKSMSHYQSHENLSLIKKRYFSSLSYGIQQNRKCSENSPLFCFL